MHNNSPPKIDIKDRNNWMPKIQWSMIADIQIQVNIDKTNKWYKYRGRTCKDWGLLESERLSKATLVVNSMCHMPNITAASVNKCTYNPEHTLLNQIVHQWTKLYYIVLASLNRILHPLHSIAFHFILHKQLFIPQKLAEKVPKYWWQNFAIVVCKSLEKYIYLP